MNLPIKLVSILTYDNQLKITLRYNYYKLRSIDWYINRTGPQQSINEIFGCKNNLTTSNLSCVDCSSCYGVIKMYYFITHTTFPASPCAGQGALYPCKGEHFRVRSITFAGYPLFGLTLSVLCYWTDSLTTGPHPELYRNKNKVKSM